MASLVGNYYHKSQYINDTMGLSSSQLSKKTDKTNLRGHYIVRVPCWVGHTFSILPSSIYNDRKCR